MLVYIVTFLFVCGYICYFFVIVLYKYLMYNVFYRFFLLLYVNSYLGILEDFWFSLVEFFILKIRYI